MVAATRARRGSGAKGPRDDEALGPGSVIGGLASPDATPHGKAKRAASVGRPRSSSSPKSPAPAQAPPSSPDKLNSFGFVDTVLEGALATSGPLSAHRFRSETVGISSLLLGLPGCCYALRGYTFGYGGVIMGLVSFLSDYVYSSGLYFDLQSRRRAFALDLLYIYVYLGAILFNLLRLGTFGDTAFCTVAMVVGAAVVLQWSGAATGPAEWEFRHTTWHVYLTWLGFKVHEAQFALAPGEQPRVLFALAPRLDAPPEGFARACVLVAAGGALLTAVADWAHGKYPASYPKPWVAGVYPWWRARRYPL